jgi:hypothetical protein
MTFNIDLVTLNGPNFEARVLRTVTVEAEDGWDATVKATDLITEAEADHVFATTPEAM